MSIQTTNRRVTKWKTFEVRLDGFENLPARKEDDFEESKFSSFGHQWRLFVWPGGNIRSDDGYVGIVLYHLTDDGKIELQTRFVVESATNLIACKAQKDNYDHDLFWAVDNFAKRSTLIGALVEGTLVIEVQMREVETNATPMPFAPENPICKIMLSKLMDEKSADVAFEVGDERILIHAHRFILEDGAPTLFDLCTSGSDSTSVSITNVKPDIFRHMLHYASGSEDEQSADGVFQVGSEDLSAIFHARRLILKGCAPALYDTTSGSGEGMTPIPITNVEPDIFRQLLRYVYGGSIPAEYLKENAKDIIDAADMYQVVNLKLEAEAALVVSTSITRDNFVELLLYSHGKNCALLKEAVIDFIVENGDDILQKVSLEDVPGALFADLLTAVSRGKKERDGSAGSCNDLITMRVSDLRKKLHEKGLEIDGSRKTMIALLDESS